MAADSEAPSATTNSEQPSASTNASAAPSAAPSAASDAASAATDASAASTSADLSNLTQTVQGGGGARSPSEKSTSSPKTQRSPSASGAKSTTGAAAHKSQEKTESKSPSTPRKGQQKRKRMKLGELDLSTAKIGFLGAGKMAESTINGLIHYGEYLIESIELYLFVACRPSEND